MKKIAVPGLLLLGGAAALYILGRWDQGISEREALHRAAVSGVLKQGPAWRARTDSLRTVQKAAEGRAARLARDRDRWADSARSVTRTLAADSASAASGPLDSLLARLQLMRVAEDAFQTDSAGVRFLADLAVEADRGRLLIPILDARLQLETARGAELEIALAAAAARADTAEARVGVLEPLLAESQRLHRCRIAGLLPCPSRGLSYVLGGVTVLLVTVAR